MFMRRSSPLLALSTSNVPQEFRAYPRPARHDMPEAFGAAMNYKNKRDDRRRSTNRPARGLFSDMLLAARAG
jgi:hypothetical protein